LAELLLANPISFEVLMQACRSMGAHAVYDADEVEIE
jgi:hypothetical protein